MSAPVWVTRMHTLCGAGCVVATPRHARVCSISDVPIEDLPVSGKAHVHIAISAFELDESSRWLAGVALVLSVVYVRLSHGQGSARSHHFFEINSKT